MTTVLFANQKPAFRLGPITTESHLVSFGFVTRHSKVGAEMHFFLVPTAAARYGPARMCLWTDAATLGSQVSRAPR